MGRPSGQRIRHFVYQFFVRQRRPPTAAETADHFGMQTADALAAFRRLHADHLLFLEPGGEEIRMANPLSAVETTFRTRIGGRLYWANCAWDMLGIAAMLGQDAQIKAGYADADGLARIAVRNGKIEHAGGVVHFLLPVRHWYQDLVYT